METSYGFSSEAAEGDRRRAEVHNPRHGEGSSGEGAGSQTGQPRNNGDGGSRSAEKTGRQQNHGGAGYSDESASAQDHDHGGKNHGYQGDRAEAKGRRSEITCPKACSARNRNPNASRQKAGGQKTRGPSGRLPGALNQPARSRLRLAGRIQYRRAVRPAPSGRTAAN
ncbi:hypothetical protein ACFONL_09570 [Camelimonas fluminis]|uniref:Uncharacterized protein n=1 Tax=Camelimonas fluminis TaxID=1576911 RepID=A0ABV7UHJ2_9HYPH|nr:hypothetical protein [Camelimonas fluminis]